MRRRVWILSVLLLIACERKAPPPEFAPTVADTWHLGMTQTFPPGSAPEFIGKQRVRTWWRASYEGPGSMTVELYELAAPAAGLDLVQRWRPVADTVVWYTPRYFVVVKWQRPDRSAVGAFIRALQKQFAEGKEDKWLSPSASVPVSRHPQSRDTTPHPAPGPRTLLRTPAEIGP